MFPTVQVTYYESYNGFITLLGSSLGGSYNFIILNLGIPFDFMTKFDEITKELILLKRKVNSPYENSIPLAHACENSEGRRMIVWRRGLNSGKLGLGHGDRREG